jgi:membrane protein DedA with SNARE-associated domain
MSDYIVKAIPQIMESMGYFGIGLLMFLENLFPPIPSELIMPLAGFAVAQGKLSFLPTVLAGVVGTVLGAFPWYYAGRVVGEPRLRRLADRYGKWLTITGKDIDKANEWFSRHEGLAVFLCRLVPGVRTLISLPAGISAMPLLPFVLYSTAGTTLWVGFLTWLGYGLGSNYSLVEKYIDPVSKLILVGLLLWFAIWVFRRKKNRRMHR